MRDDDLLNIEERLTRINEHKENPVQNRNESAVMFISAFFVMLLLFLGIAKQISPDVDVSIGNDIQTTDDTVENYTKPLIDDRLRLIQMEDEDKADKTGETIFDDSLEERVVLPENVKRKTVVTEEGSVPNDPLPTFQARKEALINSVADKTYNSDADSLQSPETPVSTPVNVKVVVGYYATPEQAQVAKGILMEAGLNINPFIKRIGNAYTIQAGSYSSTETAKNAVNELLQNNFPARIITEQ